MNECLGAEQDDLIAAIANKHMGIESIKERKCYREIESALKEALQTGIDIGIKMTVTHLK